MLEASLTYFIRFQRHYFIDPELDLQFEWQIYVQTEKPRMRRIDLSLEQVQLDQGESESCVIDQVKESQVTLVRLEQLNFLPDAQLAESFNDTRHCLPVIFVLQSKLLDVDLVWVFFCHGVKNLLFFIIGLRLPIHVIIFILKPIIIDHHKFFLLILLWFLDRLIVSQDNVKELCWWQILTLHPLEVLIDHLKPTLSLLLH